MKTMSLVRFSNSKDPITDLKNKIRHIYDLHLMLKDKDISTFFHGPDFDAMLINVGKDDVTGFRNNNEWLKSHPSSAIIFKEAEKTWNEIKTTYKTSFKELVTGILPSEKDVLLTLKEMNQSLLRIEWDI